jgi:glycosyltransferase involved in cell wall biosynthesis
VVLAYQFFHPDDVVSARLYSDLALGLVERGWEVTVLTSDRSWRDPAVRYRRREQWAGASIERLHRPAWSQSAPVARLANAAWLINAWRTVLPALGEMDVALIGSDPAFAPLLGLPMRARWPRASLVHWCFDLYPEVIVAESGSSGVRGLAVAARAMMGAAYRKYDAIVDLGPGMRTCLSRYTGGATLRSTIPPWALVEPPFDSAAPDPSLRARMFGSAKLGLLYSGTLGRAHDFEPFLALARELRGMGGAVCFACRGHRVGELRSALSTQDANVTVLEFRDESDLAAQLQTADVHLMSLKPTWSGFVVPSKFFGSLAVGRPVVYAGAEASDLARWIRELGVGWVIGDVASVASELRAAADAPGAMEALRLRAWQEYRARFSRTIAIDAWDKLLRGLSGRPSELARVGEGA